MSEVTIMGGSICGLLTALLLAEDGHRVVVLERDPALPPTDSETACSGWERRGVRQFHMGHWFHPGFRATVEAELPELADALLDAGLLQLNVLDLLPESITGGRRDGDDRFGVITGRRPAFEAVIANVADEHPGIEVRRGTAVASLIVEQQTHGDHVVGVVTESGDEVRADLLVDAAGRLSPLPRLLAAAGCETPVDEGEDSGFTYYGQTFRSPDGEFPAVLGGLLHVHDSISILTLPADSGTWFVGIVAASSDVEMRAVRDADVWTRVIDAFPLVAHWLEGENSHEVESMSKIEDRIRRFVVDGSPVVTGVAAVGDAWACTNPSVGRGSTIALFHAVELRNQLRSDPTADPVQWALEWASRTAEKVEPWYDDTLKFDRDRLAEMLAQIAGDPYETDDPALLFVKQLGEARGTDTDLVRASLGPALMLELLTDLMADADLVKRVQTATAVVTAEPAVALGPTRAELLELLH